MRCVLVSYLAFLATAQAFGQVRSSVTDEETFGPLYSTFEVRHHLNTYYEGKTVTDDGDYLDRQEPSLHFRLQLGTQIYGGLLDAYATLGILKKTQTQQILQRRPELSLDIYPIRTKHFTVMQYNMVQLPFEEREQDPEAEVDGTDAGSIITVGLAPSAKAKMPTSLGTFSVRGVVDGWTRLYSRKRYTDTFEDETTQPREDRLALNPSPDDTEVDAEDDIEAVSYTHLRAHET